jgi:hypothetical protein
MKTFELAAGRVVGAEIGLSHGMITRGLRAPRCSERASQTGITVKRHHRPVRSPSALPSLATAKADISVGLSV